MKKFLLTAVLVFIGSWVFAQESIPEGLLYEVVDDKTVTIIKYIGNTATVNIPSQIEGLLVTAIGSYAFVECKSLTSITIPSSVTYISERARYFNQRNPFTADTSC